MEMNNILNTGPSSWDRDMQGLDEEEESENLTALGMHLAGEDEEEEEEEEDEEETEEEEEDEEEEEEEEEEIEEVDELQELDRLEKELKQEESPTLVDDEE